MNQDSAARLTVPTALLALLHTDAGQPYQRFRPAPLLAAAELAELIVDEAISVDDDKITVTTTSRSGAAWQTDVLEKLRATSDASGVSVQTWLRKRGDAYKVHVEEANRAGIVATSGRKFLGLFPYKRTLVDPGARASVIARLTDPAAADDPRTSALAALVEKADVTSILDLAEVQKKQLAATAVSASDTPIGKSLDSMTVALVTIGYITTIGS